MYSIFYHGTQEGCVEKPSLADGLAGPVEPGSITIPMIKETVDEIVLVNEKEIIEAVRFAWNEYNEVIEGSAAAALAAVLSGKVSARPAVIVVSGGNIQPEVHAELIKVG
jgi:threonine dehydratase